MIGDKLKTYPDLALLLLRVGFGLYMAIGHGWGKITAGPDAWANLGGTMAMFGLDFLPTFWGFMAAFSEFVASLLVSIGLVTRPAALLVGFTMLIASLSHLMQSESPEKAAMYLFVFLAIAIYGPGKYSVDRMMG